VSAEIVRLRPAQAELDAAWAAYDASRLKVEELYRDGTSTSHERRAAVIEAERLHADFRRLYARAEVL
jgi:hypothetical protein